MGTFIHSDGKMNCFVLWESKLPITIKIKIIGLPLPADTIIGTGVDSNHKLKARQYILKPLLIDIVKQTT